jgi:hypothetical protein
MPSAYFNQLIQIIHELLHFNYENKLLLDSIATSFSTSWSLRGAVWSVLLGRVLLFAVWILWECACVLWDGMSGCV